MAENIELKSKCLNFVSAITVTTTDWSCRSQYFISLQRPYRASTQ